MSSKWISVDKRLPEITESEDGSVNCVLVYKKGGWECGSDFQVSNTVYVNKHSKWITHWMSLPDPPEVSDAS